MKSCVTFVVGLLCVTTVRAGLENVFITRTGDAHDILKKGATCTTDPSTGVSYAELRVYENDFAFKEKAGALYQYTCLIVNEDTASNNNGQLVVPTTVTKCNEAAGGTGTFQQVVDGTYPTDETVTPSTSMKRTNYMMVEIGDISGMTTDGPINCGGQLQTTQTNLAFAAFCYVEENFNHQYDMLVYFDINVGSCFDTILDTNVDINDPSDTVIDRDYDLTLKMYGSQVPDPWTSVTTMESTGALSVAQLGQGLYLELCVAIPVGDSRQYFVSGSSILGASIYECVADHDKTGVVVFGSPSAVTVIDSAGCGTMSSPMRIAEDQYSAIYAKGGQPEEQPWFVSPNCFRTQIFEAISFARLRAGTNSKLTFTCKVRYCTDLDDANCFGDVAIDQAADYGSHCPTAKRKRRAANTPEMEEMIRKMPQTISFNVTIQNTLLTKEDADALNAEQSGCFAKVPFIGLSSGLVLLVVIVLFADVFLAVKLSGRRPVDSSKGSPSTSVTGFTNTGYY